MTFLSMNGILKVVPLAFLAALSFTSCTSQEQQGRSIRFGFRELNLPIELKNAQLRLEHDELEKRNNRTRIAVDSYLIEQGRDAIQVMNRFEQIWSYTIDHDTMKGTFGTGNRELMLKFSDVEQRFDDVNRECADKHADSAPYNVIVPETVKEAEARCASFRELVTTVMERTTTGSSAPQQTFQSAPAEVGVCVTEAK